VVSTYPLSTLCLGELRRDGRLDIPAINFITDFGVHPLWVHSGIDLNLTVHELPAAQALATSGRATVACGPAISARFDPANLPDRAVARAGLGLRSGQRAVLVVAGAWGVGNLDDTWTALEADGRFTPVFVCGHDDRLLARVRAMAASTTLPSVVLGWTDDMPGLMSACDAIVENAGGLTSLEAMRAGLPVVSFEPIAGHGRENTAAMDAAGVARLAKSRHDLVIALDALTRPGPEREQQIARAHTMFRSDPAIEVVGGALGRPRETDPNPVDETTPA
jgi:UDP-N-acetylglucosamine:LPS N-acetylglucosamine transferase